MILANNGILIVALFVALAFYKQSDTAMLIAFALAGVSYVVNAAGDYLPFIDDKVRQILAFGVIGLGGVGYLFAATLLARGF